jgi:phage gpG-like protein
MSFSIQITSDTLSPRLRRLAADSPIRRAILEAMGLQLVSTTKRAFNSAALRAAPWPPHQRPRPNQLLKRSGALFQSIRIASLDPRQVTVASDRRYAATHQLGSRRSTGRGGGIPARPFFPFLNGRMIDQAERRIQAVAEAKLRSLLGP